MKIALIADTHDNLVNIHKAIDYLKAENIKTIIHCGDVSTAEVLGEMAQDFPGEIYLSCGNTDRDHCLREKFQEEKLVNVYIYEEKGEIEIGSKKIAFTHEPNLAQQLANSGEYDLVFYGHTHQPTEEKIGKTLLINPGTLAGVFNKATFALYNFMTQKAELKLLEKL